MSTSAQSQPQTATQVPRPLKRSASSASVASMTLPTPPRTRTRRNGRKKGVLSRGSSRASARSSRSHHSDDSGESSAEEADDDGDTRSHKRRRLSENPEHEDIFWKSQQEHQEDDNVQDNNSPAAHLFTRAAMTAGHGQAPVSPPCSKRQTRSSARTAPSTAGSSMASPPATPFGPAAFNNKIRTTTPTVSLLPGFNPLPKAKPKHNLLPIADQKKVVPTRDEEENPFLDSDNEQEGDEDDPFVDKPAKAKATLLVETDDEDTKEEWKEKPTIGYVFRGVRAQFANPLYAPPLPTSPTSPSPSVSSVSTTSHDPSSTALSLLGPFSPTTRAEKARLRKEKELVRKERERVKAQHVALARAKALSELPLEHPDYEAEVDCKPKLLFGVKKGVRSSKRIANKGVDEQGAVAGSSSSKKKTTVAVATTSSEWS